MSERHPDGQISVEQKCRVLAMGIDRAVLLQCAGSPDGLEVAKALAADLKGGGFDVTRVVYREGSMRFANGRALLNHHFIKLGFLDAWKQVVPDTARETFASLRNALDEYARSSGELRLSIPMAYVEARAC